MQKLFLADISTATHLDIRNKLENNDYIYVTGGNTFFLLQEMNGKALTTPFLKEPSAIPISYYRN